MDPNRGYVSKEVRDGVERAYRVLSLKDGSVSKNTQTEITGAIKNRLLPSDMGMLVSDFLSEHFSNIMEYGFTANIEKNFDTIAEGGQLWNEMIDDFYKPFHANVEDTLENADRATGERILGNDPESGRTLLTRMSRFGPLVQIGTGDELAEDEKPRYANLRPGQSLETITFEEAIDLFKLPKSLGDYEGHEVTIGVGRYGPYVKYNDSFMSLGRGRDPLEVSKEEAIELIEEKKKADAPVGTYKGLPITKGKGRFGPFLKWNEMFINIPRRFDPETISTEEMHELIAAKVEKEANRYIQKWDDLKLAVENGRWGPFIRYNKKSIKIPKVEGERITPEQAKEMTLEEVKALVEAEYPDAFKAKKKKKKAKQ
jgi:DNA topoisomerase-1